MNFFRRKKRNEEPARNKSATRNEEPARNESATRTEQAERNESEGTQPMSDVDPAPQMAEPQAPEARAETSVPESPAQTPTPTPTTAPAPASAVGGDVASVRDDVIAVLKTVYDPEIPVDIYELGLIYEVDVQETGDVSVIMTLTTPMCPVAETLPPEVEAKVREVPGVKYVQLELVWEPPWSMDMMSEAARLELNL